MKKLFTLIAVAAALLLPTASRAVTIYGYQAWEPMSDNPFRGPIYFDSASPNKPTIIADCSDMGVVYGGFYHNYHWYGQVIQRGTQSSVDGLYDIDMLTGERTLIAKGGSKMIDLTYDYSTDKVYGIRTGNQWFAEFDPSTGESTLIAKFQYMMQDVYMLAIAATLDGKFYGVGSDDVFYRISRTGTLTYIGSLGYDAGFDQSMAFDYATGTLYWANNADYTLYTIDTATGKATPIGPIGANEVSSMGSLFIPYINVAKGAPDRVTEPAATAAATAVTLTWKNPAITAQGAALADFGGVRIVRDGTTIATLVRTAADAGKADTYTDTNVVTDHDYAYEIVPFNSVGDGGVDSRKIQVHVGRDLPGAVENLTAAAGDGSALLSWAAPTKGATGGQFDAADITAYIISRNESRVAEVPANVLSYEDKASFGIYNYSVVAKTADGVGSVAKLENVLVKPGSWIIMKQGEESLEVGKTYEFYDEGGPRANYYNTRRQELVLAPGSANAYVTAKFTEFSLDTYGDYLSVYNGRGTDEANLIGKFSATSVPALLEYVESSADDGCLTFLFYADIMDAQAGWKAAVECKQLRAADIAVTAFGGASLAVAEAPAQYQVTLVNHGVATASDVTVELLVDGKAVTSVKAPAIASRKSATVALSYAHPFAGTATVSARAVYAADVDASNNSSESLLQTILAKGSKIVDIFSTENATMYVMPISFMSMESVYQTIYTPEELPQVSSLYLSSLAFPYAVCDVSYKEVPVAVYVGETPKTNLADGSIPVSQLSECFNGKVDISPASGMLEINLDKAYPYRGGNLVVMVYKGVSATNNGGVSFRGEYAYSLSRNASRFDSHSDSSYYPPFNLEENFGYSAQNMRADARLIFSSTDTGVEGVTAQTRAPAFALRGSSIEAHEPLKVYDLAGRLIADMAQGDSARLAAGYYIVSTGAGAAKISVR